MSCPGAAASTSASLASPRRSTTSSPHRRGGAVRVSGRSAHTGRRQSPVLRPDRPARHGRPRPRPVEPRARRSAQRDDVGRGECRCRAGREGGRLARPAADASSSPAGERRRLPPRAALRPPPRARVRGIAPADAPPPGAVRPLRARSSSSRGFGSSAIDAVAGLGRPRPGRRPRRRRRRPLTKNYSSSMLELWMRSGR